MIRSAQRLAPFMLVAALAALAACGGGGGGGNPLPVPTATPTPPSATPTPPPPTPAPTVPPTVTGYQADLYLDSTTPLRPQVVRRGALAAAGVQPEIVARRRFASSDGPRYAPGLIEVTYERQTFLAQRDAIAHAAATLGASVQTTFDFGNIGKVMQVLQVRPGTEEAAIQQLKSEPNVEDANRDPYRYLQSTTAAFPNDPYFNGFGASYEEPPVYENSQLPGQWDMHAIFAANAWGYSQPNTTGTTYAGANGGSSSFPIAIIDTGADLTHPELQGRAIWAESIIKGVKDANMTDMRDDDGHGTDVAGIAAASANNSFGFAGVAYNAPLMIYRVFPNPPCSGSACYASSSDIAAAIADAVNRGAKVINMSLGSSTPDNSPSGEEAQVKAAIQAGVIVVAAAGNGDSAGVGQPSLDYPAADPGVIAVGASAIDDSNPQNAGLKVASYSNYATTKTPPGGGVFLVAPGGDPCPNTSAGTPCGDADDLHWIENIYSSTAVPTVPCVHDFDNPTGPVDCRILIAGTSQATPHVTGAVALLLSIGDTPATIPSDLCNNATLIPNYSLQEGCGQLNVYHAMNAFLGDTYP